jgi:transposase
VYASGGRLSIPPETAAGAVLQMLYSIRSERLLMEEIDYSMLFRWFVALNLDEEVWDATNLHQKTTIGCWKPSWPKSFRAGGRAGERPDLG